MNAPAAVGAAGHLDARTAEVWAQLAAVNDPELDETVTERGFVTGIEVEAGGAVQIGFRLPTYWCAANFAYLMADDMRRAVAALPWVTKVAVRLGEHMYADEINCGVAAGASFQDTFGAAANGEVEDVRQIFLVKAFQRRQEALLSWLLAQGGEGAVLVRVSMMELDALASGLASASASDEANGIRLVTRYRERRFVVGPRIDEAAQANALAFVDSDGVPLDPAGLNTYLRALRRVGVSTEFNGALCRGLLAARYGEAGTATAVEIKPVHFMDLRAHGTGSPCADSGQAARPT
jgi:metal-sulfur cluster biosynthetic enzyme